MKGRSDGGSVFPSVYFLACSLICLNIASNPTRAKIYGGNPTDRRGKKILPCFLEFLRGYSFDAKLIFRNNFVASSLD